MPDSHYRRLAAGAMEALIAPHPSEYHALATFGGVRVGEAGDAVIVHVVGLDREGLPGEFAGESIDDLAEEERPHVYRATWAPLQDGEDPGYGPVSDIPPGATVTATDLIPNTFF